VGASFDTSSDGGVRRQARYTMIQQLTFDPSGQFGGAGGSLPAEQAVILAFSNREVLSLKVGTEVPRRNANVLYYVPIGVTIEGPITFTSDLLRQTTVDSSALFFSKERGFLSMNAGSATLAYQPIPFDGTFKVSEIRLSLSGAPDAGSAVGGKAIEPLPSIPVGCTDSNNTIPKGCLARRDDFLPEVEVFDRTGEGAWVRLPRLVSGATYSLANPTRYIDPATGQLLVRFVNDSPEATVGFGFPLALVGVVE
jgi:hypothetical protein